MEKEKNTDFLDFENFLKFLQNINYINSDKKAFGNLLFKMNSIETTAFQIDDLDSTNIQNVFSEGNNNKSSIAAHNELLELCKSLYDIEIDLPLLYEIYKGIDLKLHKSTYTFAEFHNLFKLLNHILVIFNEDLLRINLHRVWEENIVLFVVDDNDSINTYKAECNNYFMEERFSDLEEEAVLIYRNILLLFYVFSMCGKLSFNLPSSKIKLDTFVTNVNVYNKIYISHVNFLLLVHLMMIHLYHISLNEENKYTSILTPKKKGKIVKSPSLNSPNLTISPPVCYFFENITNKVLENDEVIRICLTITNIKYFLFPYLPENVTISIKVLTPDFFSSTMFYYEYNSQEFNKNMILTKNLIINLTDLSWVLGKNNIKIDEFHLSIWKGIVFYEVQNMQKKFEPFALKSKNFILKDSSSINGTFLTIENFTNEIDLLEGVINFILKIYKIKKKKKEEFAYFIHLNFFTLFLKDDFSIQSMNSTNQNKNNNVVTKTIVTSINYNNLKEEDLLKYLCQICNYSKFYQNLKNFITKLQLFKKHHYHITLNKTAFESEELNYLINLLALILYNYGEEKGFKNILVNEIEKFISPRHTLVINNLFKEKNKKIYLQKFLKNFQNPTMSVFYKYADQILMYFPEIIMHDLVDNHHSFKSSSILRNFKNNKLILRNLSDNSFSFDIYLHESGKMFYEKIAEFIKSLKSNTNIAKAIKEVTIVMSKSYFEDIVNKEYFNSTSTKDFYALVDKFYIVNLESEYDIYVLEKRLCILINRPINQQVKNNLSKEHFKETHLKKVIYEVCRVLYEDLKSISNSQTKSTLEILLSTKEKFFSHVTLVFKSHQDSSLKVIDLCEGHFSINKIKKDNFSTTYVSEIFDNLSYLKKANWLPLFAINCKDATNLINLMSLILPLQKFLVVRSNYFRTNDISEPEQVSQTSDLLFEFLHQNLFQANIESFIPVVLSLKYFFNFLKVFKNLYFTNKGEVFKKVYIIPLTDESNKINNFVSEINHFNTLEYMSTERILFFHTDRKNTNFDLLTRGFPFHHSRIETSLKLIKTTYEKMEVGSVSYINLPEGLSFFYLINSAEMSIRNNKRLSTYILKLAGLNNPRNKILLQILKFLRGAFTVEVFSAKNHLMDALVNEILAEKGEKINRDKIQQLTQMDKKGQEESTGKINHQKRKSSHKKCLIY